MIADKTKLYRVISVWVALVFTQSRRVTGKLELVQSHCVKSHRVTGKLERCSHSVLKSHEATQCS